MLKNVTLTLDENLARRARVWAAREDVSLSRYLARILEERLDLEESYDRSMAEYLSRAPGPLKSSGGYPSRSELHER